MVPTLQIRLLGDFSLVYGDQPVVSFTSSRLQSLLTYLVLHRDVPQYRQHLAFLFWPDAIESQARNNLRQLLHQLRQALPAVGQFLHIDASTLRWQLAAPCSLDVAEFERAVHLAEVATRLNDQQALRAALEQATTVYRGDLLPSCYDDWIIAEREKLRQCHLQALEQLLRVLEVHGDTISAIRCAQRLIQFDPLSEDLYRRLMQLLALNNDRAGALRVYQTCATTLQSELGVEPEPATREAYERLLHLQAPAVQAVERAVERPSGFTPIPARVGREQEWNDLQVAWHRAAVGTPHFVLVTGEAGIGKTRLAEDFLAWASRQGIATAKTRSYAAEGQLPLAPVTDWLRSDGLRSHLGQLDPVWLTEVARLLPELFVERAELPRYEPVTEYGQRRRFFEALAHALLVGQQPLMLLIDDLQWCDQETLEWLHFLLRFDSMAPLLVVGCARTEELPSHHSLRALLLHLRSTAAVTEIVLQPLDAAETAKLAAEVAQGEWDSGSLMRLYHETGGYPLFVVEMVRAGLGRAPGSLPEVSSPSVQPPLAPADMLPPRVQAVLVGRLLQLSASAHAFLELAATIGCEFTFDLLISASNAEVDTAVCALDELWQKRIVREVGANRYDFTHDKLREVAYAEINVPQRRLLHRRIAQALEALHAEDLDLVSGQIASQYERAGMAEKAIPAYQRAAAVAQRRFANEGAISLLVRGLELLEWLPAGSQRDQQELHLQVALIPIYSMTKGWTAPELERTLYRTLELCDLVGSDEERAQALFVLQSMYAVQAKLDKVPIVFDELQTLYQRLLGAPPPPLTGVILACTLLHMGRITEANQQFVQIFTAQAPDQLLHLQESQGVNYAAYWRAMQSHALWCLGYPEQALSRGLEAVKLVRDLDQPFNQALVSAYLALLQQLGGDEAIAREHAEEALALSTKYQASYYQAWANILVSFARASEQPNEEAIRHLRESISTFTSSGARLRLPYYLSLLARVYGKAGRCGEGLACIDEALSLARAHNERWWDAELHRLRGELLLANGAEVSAVEAAMTRAIEIAQSQQARSLELRATMSLARCCIAQHRCDDASRRLHDLYHWFTEGFDTPDLQAARLLLAELPRREHA